MVPSMTIDWVIWDRNYSNIGFVSVEGTKGSTLGEVGLVEGVVRGAAMDTALGGRGDIPQGKGVDILQGDSRQGLGQGSCVGADLCWGEQLAGVVPDWEQLGMDTIPQHLGSPPLSSTAGEDSRWRGSFNEGR